MVVTSFAHKSFSGPRSIELLLAALLFLVAGCGSKPDRGQISSFHPILKRSYTKTELDRSITSGMSVSDITNTFGPPTSMLRSSEHTGIMTFLFPIDLAKRMNEETMVGFDIHTKDGKVVIWSPIIAGPEGQTQPSSQQNQKSTRLFSLFVATDNLRNVLETLDAGGQADMINAHINPDLTLSAHVFLDDRNDRPWSDQVALVLSPADALRLKTLTETNIGKRLLIVCSNKVVAAPTITDPLERRELLLRVKGTNALNILRGTPD